MVYFYSYVLLLCFAGSEKIVSKQEKEGIFLGTLCLVRLLLENMLAQYPEILSMSVHTSPIIRCIDFLLGMVAAKYFMKYKNKLGKNRFAFSIFEMVIMAGVILIDIYLGEKMPRTIFVVLFCVLVFTFAFNKGILSVFLTNEMFKRFSTVQLEFYMFHGPVGSFTYLFLGMIFPVLTVNKWTRVCVVFVLLLMTIYIYRKFLKKKMELGLARLLNGLDKN